MLNAIRLLCCLTLLILIVPGAQAEDKEFTGGAMTADWHSAGNWFPSGVPVDGDDVTIPNDKTCVISTANADADTVTVANGGTLGIEGKILNVDLTLTANGTVYFKKPSTDKPEIRFDSMTAVLNGSGTVSAAAPTYGGPAIITNSAKLTTFDIEIGSSVTVKGSVLMIASFTNNGTLVVDHANDSTEIGPDANRIEREGSFEVSAGEMIFDIGGTELNDDLDFELSGGKMQFKTGTFCTTGFFTISGGTLDVDTDFLGTGGFTYSGGTVKVAASKRLALDATDG